MQCKIASCTAAAGMHTLVHPGIRMKEDTVAPWPGRALKQAIGWMDQNGLCTYSSACRHAFWGGLPQVDARTAVEVEPKVG